MSDLNQIPVHDEPLAEQDHVIAVIHQLDGITRLRRLPRARLSAPPPTYAKGDLLVADSDGVLQPLPIGADGQVLTANATAPLGLAWETPGGGDGALALTNAQKLALPADTTPGTRVDVTDAFYVSGFSGDGAGGNGLFVPAGTHDGKPAYARVGSGGLVTARWVAGHGSWFLGDDSVGDLSVSGKDVGEPWLASEWQDNGYGVPTLAHPAPQVLAAPSDALAAVAVIAAGLSQPLEDDGSGGVIDGGGVGQVTGGVLGGGASSFQAVAGIYTQRGEMNGKPCYNLLGAVDDPGGASCIFYVNGWRFYDADTQLLYRAPGNAAFPWLATWILGPDGEGAVPAFASVTQGQLDAGVTVSGAGTATSNGVFARETQNGGLPFYLKVGGPASLGAFGTGLHDETADDVTYDTQQSQAGALAHAFPWEETWVVANGAAPAPAVARNDVAAEPNWQRAS